jgi:hypothetical protein
MLNLSAKVKILAVLEGGMSLAEVGYIMGKMNPASAVQH